MGEIYTSDKDALDEPEIRYTFLYNINITTNIDGYLLDDYPSIEWTQEPNNTSQYLLMKVILPGGKHETIDRYFLDKEDMMNEAVSVARKLLTEEYTDTEYQTLVTYQKKIKEWEENELAGGCINTTYAAFFRIFMR